MKWNPPVPRVYRKLTHSFVHYYYFSPQHKHVLISMFGGTLSYQSVFSSTPIVSALFTLSLSFPTQMSSSGSSSKLSEENRWENKKYYPSGSILEKISVHHISKKVKPSIKDEFSRWSLKVNGQTFYSGGFPEFRKTSGHASDIKQWDIPKSFKY